MTDKNTLIHEIPNMSYLKEGDYVRLVRGRATARETIFATADMDGHRVSENYGSQRGYYLNPEHNYINVKFDHVTYRLVGPNTTIYERDNWRIFVDKATYVRVMQFIEKNEKSAKRARVEQKLADAERLVAEARAELQKLNS
jgi:hypothetical protein